MPAILLLRACHMRCVSMENGDDVTRLGTVHVTVRDAFS